MKPLPNPVPPYPSGRDALPPSGWRQTVATGGGALAGCGFGMLLLILFVMLLLVVGLGNVIAGFFYGGMIFELPIAIAFLLVWMGLGTQSALRQYRASGNRVPPLSIAGYCSVVLVAVVVSCTVGYYLGVEAQHQETLRNSLHQQYGYLYYPNATPHPNYAGRMRTNDSYQKVTGFYSRLPDCDTTKIASGGGTFIIPCHAPGGTPDSHIYLRINSRVDNNIPYLMIDTTTSFEW